MKAVDFDFQRYVARRKGARAAQVREGAAYAYPGDVRLLRTLDRLRPVQLALAETGRLWRQAARAELLGPSVKVTPERYPAVHKAVRRCAEILHIDMPAVYVSPHPAGVYTLGTEEETSIVLSQGLLDALTADELLDVLGRECGRIQNGHVPFRTALHYLSYSANAVVRWAVKPATMTLQAWSRRADITADRAGLLCARDFDVSLSALKKMTASVAAGPVGAATEVSSRELEHREKALRRFEGSAYYKTVLGVSVDEGENAEQCDAAVAQILDDKDPSP